QADIGSVRVGVSKICSDIEISQNQLGAFEARLKDLGKLEIQSVDFSGLKVSVDADVSGFWGFINKVTKIFGFDIENRIAEAVRTESTATLKSQIQLSSREIRSGQWLQRYLTEGHVQGLLDKAAKQLNRNLSQAGFGSDQIDAMVQGSCLSLASSVIGFSDQLRAQFFKLCRSSVKVSLRHFLDHKATRDSGCNDYFFHPEQRKWWATRCFLKSEATVEIKSFSVLPGLDDVYQCLSSVWGSNVSLAQCQKAASGVLDTLLGGLPLPGLEALPPMAPPTQQQLDQMRDFLSRVGAPVPDREKIRRIWN
ncbi:MAG: hypothetical protein KGQ59_11175, partial [Bdellovibrionales bacterium]|nr:hypothetical protein [Bdellovibrionales bacterium]